MSRREIFAHAYDALLRPLEAGALGRWRERVWRHVPAAGLGLEVGAGTGANFAHHPSTEVIATDLSIRMLGRARAKSAGATRLLAADVLALPFADETFEWVAETLVFCEVRDPVSGLREIRRVLRPGGTLVMLEHVRPGGLAGRAADLLTRLSGPLLGEHFDRDPERSLEEAGFQLDVAEWVWRDLVQLLVARAPAEG